jgi:peptide/nickel transport system ATP-binding protein
MYAGQIVEKGPVRAVLQHPVHPYLQGLMNMTVQRGLKGKQLVPIAGPLPALTRLPVGWSFAPRCPSVQARCVEAFPDPYRVSADIWRAVFCWRAYQ